MKSIISKLFSKVIPSALKVDSDWVELCRANLPKPYSYCWFVRNGYVMHGTYVPYESESHRPEHFAVNGSFKNRMWIHKEGITHWKYWTTPSLPHNIQKEK